jgi:hypothetical protein
MTTNWGDIAINEMADKDERRLREARFLLNADRFPSTESNSSLARIAHTIRQYLTRSRAADQADMNVNLDTRQESAV